MELSLTSKLYRWDCPPNQVLGEYQLGLLSNEIAAAVTLHLGACVLCTMELTMLEQFLANDPYLIERVPVQTSSLNNHHTPRALKPLADRLRERSGARVRRIVATMLPQQPRFSFVRDVAGAEVWPRRYTAEDFSISIQIEQGASRRDSLKLIGFVTRKGTTLKTLQGIPVVLSSQTHEVYTQNIDDLGNFVFSSIAPETYTLELQLPDSTIVIEQLPITLRG
jgi:hypothetical protein